jgi:RimJ/RimL family protein N-acetyltransferase
MSPARSSHDPGALLSTVHELGDGTLARLRLTRPSDAPRVRAFLETLSEPSRYRRFLTAVEGAPETIVRHFTFYEPSERLMLAATCLHEGTEVIIGLADVAMLDTGLVELAVVVSDEHQGKGVGSLLSAAVASIAARRGATHLKATMAADNERMLRLMERLGQTVCTREDQTLVAYTRLEHARARSAA